MVLSAAALALGLAIIIVVLGIMQGLQQGYLRDIIEVDAYHITAGPVSADDLDVLMEAVPKGIPYGESEMLLLQSDGLDASIRLRGLGGAYQEDTGFYDQIRLVRGTLDLKDDGVLIGSALAYRHGIRVGETVKAATVVRGRIVRAVPSVRYLTVTGIYATDYPDIDGKLGFTTIDTIKSMGIDRFYIGIKTSRLEDEMRRLSAMSELDGVRLITWKEAYESFYGALILEKYSMMVVLLLIFLVVAINIRSSFERFLYEKRNEIGIMKTLGASSRDIQTVLCFQGLFIAGFSLIPGLLIGVLTAGNVNVILHGIDRAAAVLFPMGLGITGIRFPVMITWPEIGISILVMIGFILWAVFSSAQIINRYTPMEMFRYE